MSFAHPNGHNTAANQNSSGGTTTPLQSWGPGSDSFFSMSTDVGTIQTPSSEPVGTGYHVINVTAHVQAWVNGTSPNYGWAQDDRQLGLGPQRGRLRPSSRSCSSTTASGGGDTTAPAAVSNLAAGSPTTNSITLTWTAPGDDGSTGTASQLRHPLPHRRRGQRQQLGQRHAGDRRTDPGGSGHQPEHDRQRPVCQHDLLLRHQDLRRGAQHLGPLQQPQRHDH